MRAVLVVLAVLVGGVALACQFDTDCEVGSKCIKRSGAIYGVCMGGLSPGNDNDNVPVRSPNPLKKKAGNTCQFDIDCDIGGSCAKESGALKGVCI